MSITTKVTQSARLGALAVRRPVEFYDRLAGRRQRLEMGPPPEMNAAALAPLAAAHTILGVPDAGCCDAVADVRSAVSGRLTGQHHHDAGTALAEILWVLVRHKRPTHVVETGVARGVSSAFILDAMSRNGAGHLWSIDLPPMSADWHGQTGMAIAGEHRDRWTYVRGASRRHLKRVVDRAGVVDIFLHDGLHTADNMLFEMRTVWPKLSDGGVLLADDADDNEAAMVFGDEIGQQPMLIREPDKVDVLAVFPRVTQ